LDPTIRSIILIVLIVLLFLAVSFAISRYFLIRAMRTVVRIFRDRNALDDASARTKEDLGIADIEAFQFKAFFDYKPTAFRVLLRSGVIRISRDAKRFFLSEQLISQTDLEKKK
jgi:hypothetical protein